MIVKSRKDNATEKCGRGTNEKGWTHCFCRIHDDECLTRNILYNLRRRLVTRYSLLRRCRNEKQCSGLLVMIYGRVRE